MAFESSDRNLRLEHRAIRDTNCRAGQMAQNGAGGARLAAQELLTVGAFVWCERPYIGVAVPGQEEPLGISVASLADGSLARLPGRQGRSVGGLRAWPAGRAVADLHVERHCATGEDLPHGLGPLHGGGTGGVELGAMRFPTPP